MQNMADDTRLAMPPFRNPAHGGPVDHLPSACPAMCTAQRTWYGMAPHGAILTHNGALSRLQHPVVVVVKGIAPA